jgi:hypothetical protein
MPRRYAWLQQDYGVPLEANAFEMSRRSSLTIGNEMVCSQGMRACHFAGG